MLHRHAEDFAAGDEGGALAVRAEREVLDEVAHAARAGVTRHEVARHADVERLVAAGRGVVEMQRAIHFENDLALAIGAGPARVFALVVGQLARFAAADVEAVEVQVFAAVGKEIDRIADPHRIAIGVLVGGDVARATAGNVVDVEILRPAADVAVPGPVVAELRRVDDLLAVRRILAAAGGWHRQGGRQATGDGDLEQFRVRDADCIAGRAENHGAAVRGPAVDLAVDTPALRQRPGSRVPGQLARLTAAGGDHEDLVVAAVLAGEGDLAAIR